MSQHPLNLAFRFGLELAALAALGAWGWAQRPGVAGWLLAVLVPALAMIAWAVFRVPGDPPGKQPVVAVPGVVRLLLEAAIFASAVWALSTLDPAWATALGLAVAAHYLVSYDRVLAMAWGQGMDR